MPKSKQAGKKPGHPSKPKASKTKPREIPDQYKGKYGITVPPEYRPQG